MEQGYKQVKQELGGPDFQLRSDRAIRRHWALVGCAFSFCWWAEGHQHRRDRADDATRLAAEATDSLPLAQEPGAGEKGGPPATRDLIDRAHRLLVAPVQSAILRPPDAPGAGQRCSP